MYEMSKMTLEQEEVRNQEYNEYVEQMTPKHNLWANMGKACLLGGGICLLGQIILQIAAGVFGLKAEDAALWCSLLLVLLSVILTSCNVYGILANWGGAGALVPSGRCGLCLRAAGASCLPPSASPAPSQ